MPISLLAGQNLLGAMPAIVLLNVLVLMPIATLAMYGIGKRIGGRLFGYWVALCWIAVPYIGIKYADAGYHQRYTEAALPQGLGLTAMSDFPSMVMLAVGAYFLICAIQRAAWIDGVLAGLFVGFGIGVKASNLPLLPSAALTLLACRPWRAALAFSAGLAPCILTLLVWKSRGRGSPFLHRYQAGQLATS